MRSLVFNVLFYTLSSVFAILCVILSFLPTRWPLMGGLFVYSKLVVVLMRLVAGIKVEIRGKEHVPNNEMVIFAAKHQSYGDGLVMFSQFFDLSVVIGDHLNKFMTIRRILDKSGAMIVNKCGSGQGMTVLEERGAQAKKNNRRVLIYPEGKLSVVGTSARYRGGVFLLYQQFDCKVVPVATNLGQRWHQNRWRKYKGDAVLEFLPPIEPGLDKRTFMEALRLQVETRSHALLDKDNLGALDTGVLDDPSPLQA